MEGIRKLYEEEICEQDIIIFIDTYYNNLSEDDLDLTECFNSYKGEHFLYSWFPLHTTVYGNELVVEEIMNKILLPIIRNKK